ncbi:DNA translocase FtsK [Psychrobacter sp. DM4]|uniref:DNA translocase FtsK n=1 Tax=Psychrobacter sp. DM4 TaxID=3440637 RepID=UPI003F50ABD6
MNRIDKGRSYVISASVIEYLKKGIFTILGLIVAVYLFVILLTYTGNDPSWSHISSDMNTINNMGGAMGAWLSDLLYSFFGFGAWWLFAFLVYESILIWWESKPTFWPLRLMAYVFLLLSASALFAQLVALIQQVADPVATGLKGVAGGIIGLELQARLAQLLSQWGSVAFLALFVIITATFAFNIHWQQLYHKLTDLGWLGSGVSDKSTQLNSRLDGTQSAEKNNIEDQDNIGFDQSDDGLGTARITAQNENVNRQSGQLPLELPENQEDYTANSGRFGTVLTDFLSKSGLKDSVKASMAIAATEAAAIGRKPQTAMASVSVSSHPAHKSLTETTPTPLRKVEPSFAWNDASTVDDLLATGDFVNNYGEQHEPESDSAPVVATELSNTDKPIVSPSTTPLASTTAATPVFDDKLSNGVTIEDDASQVDELADAWLAEHGTIPNTTLDTMPSTTPNAIPDSSSVIEDEIDELSIHNDSTEIASAPLHNETVAPVIEPQVDTQNVSSPPATDMTPTNTPPANPKLPPTAVAPVSAIVAEPVVPEPSTPKSHIGFAVPEGDSSNHITDMMPDHNDSDAPVMPDISDDAAFSQKSRAMQTAEYRGNLTPIPEISILDKPDPDRMPSYTVTELKQLSELLEIKLQEFNVKAEVVNAIPGPVVTRFEVELAAGVKASKVTGISRDLARSLSMASLRVVEVIPGKPYIGIEVPNKKREMVRLIELLNTEKFKDPKAQISMAMGKDIGGNAIITDLARAPHMLVAGTTGSGKSVLVNSMLLSMLLKYKPDELRLILIDPKQLELANYNDIPHLLTPVVTDMTEAASSLSWCVAEMERRYQLMSLLKVRKLDEFNKKVRAAEAAGKPMLDPLWRPNDSVSISQAPKLKTLPMIVIVADEFADMIMQVGKQAEELITRLAQKSRAAGIHLMLATQRPSVDVITGLIKANIPVRAALRVNSKVDSRTILDSGGAEDMLGNGDMLFLGPGQIEPDRVHGAYVSDEEVNRVCDAWRERGAPDYIDNMAGNFELSGSSSGSGAGSSTGEDDDLYNDAVAFIMETRKVSASSIQRKFSIGYNRAARIVDSMEEAGLVSSMGKSGKRELLM